MPRLLRLLRLLVPLALAGCSSGSDETASVPSSGGAAGVAGASGQAGAAGLGGAAGQGGATAGSAGAAGSTAGAAGEGGASGQAGAAGSPGGSSGASGAPVCVPGQSVACVGPGACQGGQACLPDGSGYGPCDCGTAGSGGASGEGGSAGAGGEAGAAGAGGQGGAAICACESSPTPLIKEPGGKSLATGPVMSTFCPSGASLDGDPLVCTIEFDWAESTLSFVQLEDGTREVFGQLRVRVQFLPVETTLDPVKVPMTLSLGSGPNPDCSNGGYSPVGIKAVFLPASNAELCAPLGPPTNLFTTFVDNDVRFCGKCDIPIACGPWDEISAGTMTRAKELWSDAIRAQLATLSAQSVCLDKPMLLRPVEELRQACRAVEVRRHDG